MASSDSSSFRVANFNVHNLNAPGIRFAGREKKDGAPLPQNIYDSKVAWISRLCDTAKVDLIGFEELFSKTALEDIIAKTAYLQGDHGANVYAPDLDDNVSAGPYGQEARGPFCGLVTRFPIIDASSIRQFPDTVRGKLRVLCGDNRKDTIPIPIEQFQRPVLRVDVQLRPETIATVFVAHLKSKTEQIFDEKSGVPAACPDIAVEDKDDPIVQALGSARSLILRAAEAAALRSLIVATATGNTKPIIVLGDLNDDLDSVTTQMIAGDDPFFLPRPKKEAAFDRLLYSVHDIQERLSHRQFNYSHIYNSRYELLDHIFVSEEFVEQNPKHIAEVRNTRIYNDHLFDSKLTSDRTDGPTSTTDHGVPVTEIRFEPSTPP